MLGGAIDVNVTKVLQAPIDPKQIKERDAGFGKKLKYVSGSYVISKLNEAFGYQWSFEVLEKNIIKSEPKLNKKTNTAEEQPPYMEVLGRLTVPGVGIKEQYGTKVILGGASEQEGVAKAATTDALKKCATMLGIGLELYEDEPVETPQYNNKANYNNYNKGYDNKTYNKPEVKTETSTVYKQGDIDKLKELKGSLGVKENSQLDDYVKEFTGDSGASYKSVTPNNIAAFNVFLAKKAQGV